MTLSDPRSVKVDDAQAVLWSAEILEKTEFEVFETAYRAWYREPADERQLERIFAGYMFDEVVPFWVRQFTRETLQANDHWCRDQHTQVHVYLGACLRGASTSMVSTLGLALSLFVPRLVFPWIETSFAALPA
jgi:hypothetical protein